MFICLSFFSARGSVDGQATREVPYIEKKHLSNMLIVSFDSSIHSNIPGARRPIIDLK